MPGGGGPGTRVSLFQRADQLGRNAEGGYDRFLKFPITEISVLPAHSSRIPLQAGSTAIPVPDEKRGTFLSRAVSFNDKERIEWRRSTIRLIDEKEWTRRTSKVTTAEGGNHG